MGPPKQKWTSEEEASLRAGLAKNGVGKWRAILKDPQFSSTLCYRSNVDLKDKWRNINFTATSTREKERTALKKTRSTPKNDDHDMEISIVTSDINDKIVDEKPIAAVPCELLNWTSEEESSLRVGVAKHGVGKWAAILKDPQFSSTSCYRSNVDLKNKWRSISFTATSTREKERTALKKTRSNPKSDDHAMEIVASDINDEIVDEKPIAVVPCESLNWTSEEEASLRAGVAKHGVGKWAAILKDSQFSSTLCYRSNVDLKDKWYNINLTATSAASRKKGRTVLKKAVSTPKNDDHAMAISTTTSDINDKNVHEKAIAAVPHEALNTSSPKKPHSRLDNIIMEAIKNLNEPMGSHRTTIATYIEEQYWPSSDFDQLLSAKLKDLATSGKLMKVKRKYKIAPISPLLDKQIPKMGLLEDLQRRPFKFVRDDIKTLSRSQVDAELAHMATLTAEEAAAAATRAVAEAEAIMAEAEAAAREAEAAEANAQAAQAAFYTLKNRNATKMITQA